MNQHENLQLKTPGAAPTDETLEKALGTSYSAYEALQAALPPMEMEQAWQWYAPLKAWLAKGQHYWTTKRGTQKEKTLYWLYVFEGYFDIAVWFKEKNRAELLGADVSEKTKNRIGAAETMGKLPTFPVIFTITTVEELDEVYALINWKKRLEL